MDSKQAFATGIKNRSVIVLIISAALLSTIAHALPPEFTATYSARSYGMTVAEATYTLKHSSNGINFSQHSEPVGLAALFSDDELDETSLLSLHNGRLLLDKYSFIQKGDSKNRDIHLAIKWKHSNDSLTGNISGTSGGKPVSHTVTGPVWDTLSFQIPVMMNTTADAPPREYAILVKDELKTYTFITHGEEKIMLSGNATDTIKVERKDNKGGDPIFFWVAGALNNLPVKIEKWKNNKPKITMSLKNAVFATGSEVVFREKGDHDDEFE